MEPVRMTTTEAILYTSLLTGGVSFFLGLVPLCFGYFKGRTKLGVLGIVSATISGALLGIYISLPIIAIFMWLIIENKLARAGIGACLTCVGVFLAIFAYIRQSSLPSEGFEEFGGQNPVFLALIIGGVIFGVVGAVLFIISFLPRSKADLRELPDLTPSTETDE